MLGVVLIASVVAYFSGIISFDKNEINTSVIEGTPIKEVKKEEVEIPLVTDISNWEEIKNSSSKEPLEKHLQDFVDCSHKSPIGGASLIKR